MSLRHLAAGTTLALVAGVAKKGQTLRRAAGKKISVGIKSPADAQTSVPVQATFSTP